MIKTVLSGKLKFLKLTILFLITVFLTACVSVPSNKEVELLPEQTLLPADVNWTELEPGFDLTEFFIKKIKVNWACVRVNLATAGLTFTAQPDENTIITINTTPYEIKNGKSIPLGIVKIAGEQFYKANPKYCALCLTRRNLNEGYEALILPSQSKQIEDYDYAFGGYYSILQDGQIIEFARYRHSRTACGLSSNGQYLYIFACTSINDPADNSGLTYEECAIILQALGCNDAMEFDGGHSTQLIIYGEDIIKPALQKKVPANLSITVE